MDSPIGKDFRQKEDSKKDKKISKTIEIAASKPITRTKPWLGARLEPFMAILSGKSKNDYVLLRGTWKPTDGPAATFDEKPLGCEGYKETLTYLQSHAYQRNPSLAKSLAQQRHAKIELKPYPRITQIICAPKDQILASKKVDLGSKISLDSYIPWDILVSF